MTRTTLLACLLLGGTVTAFARTAATTVQRDINQQQRIENGVRSGALTNREVAKLERGQSKMAKAEGNAARDGHVSAQEQARVQHAEDHQSKRIYRQKHDAQQKN